MAQRTIVELTDDLDGGKADVTVSFALDGKSYEIDLTEQNADKLRESFREYLVAGRRVGANLTTIGSRGRKGGTARSKSQTGAIREWAVANGHKVSSRGRIPAPVEAAYAAAH